MERAGDVASSSKEKETWFGLLLLVNSVGILPLIYLLFVEKGEVFGRKRRKRIQ